MWHTNGYSSTDYVKQKWLLYEKCQMKIQLMSHMRIFWENITHWIHDFPADETKAGNWVLQSNMSFCVVVKWIDSIMNAENSNTIKEQHFDQNNKIHTYCLFTIESDTCHNPPHTNKPATKKNKRTRNFITTTTTCI